jgi:hypothetical protein
MCLEKLKDKFCKAPIGQLVNNSVGGFSALSGGLIQGCCPQGPTAAQLAMPSTSAEGAAAQIQKDTAEAKARRAAVRYLGTVDCHYWPEAKAALIMALRADRNECVRLEAALALARGCCCNKATIMALNLTVSGSDEDGNPSENSERVKAAAYFALGRCLATVPLAPPAEVMPEQGPPPPILEKPRETIPPPETAPRAEGKVSAVLPAYYQRLESSRKDQVIARARQTLAMSSVSLPVPTQPRTNEGGIVDLFAKAWSPHTPGDKDVEDTQKSVVKPDSAAASIRVNHDSTVGKPVTSSDSMPSHRLLPSSLKRLWTQGMKRGEPQMPATPVTESAGNGRPVVPAPVPVQQVVPATAPVPAATGNSRPATGNSQPTVVPAVNSSSRPTAAVPSNSVNSRATAAVSSNSVKSQPTPAVASNAVKSQPSAAVASKSISSQPTTPMALPKVNIQPASYAAPVAPSPVSRPTVSTPVPQAASMNPNQVQELLRMLKQAVRPDVREWAADHLVSVNWRTNPQVVQTLVEAATQDSVPFVRVACIQCLGNMGANTMPVVSALRALKSDSDPRVRYEAQQALMKLVPGQVVSAGH